MHARLDHYLHRATREFLLALVAAGLVAAILLFRPSSLFGLDRFTVFPLTLALGTWLPLLAPSHRGATGQLRLGPDSMRLTGRRRVRRFPLREVDTVRAAPATRGASLLVGLKDGSLLAFTLDHPADAAALAAAIRDATGAGDRTEVWWSTRGVVVWGLRLVATAMSLGYYLHVVAQAIPGEKAFYGLGALAAGAALLVLHLVRHRTAHLGEPVPPAALASCPPTLRAHLRAHLAAPPPAESAARPRLTTPDEPADAWLARARRELAGSEAYRGAAHALRAQLELVLGSADAPLRERALALRALAGRDPAEVKRRIAVADSLPPADRAWVEEVALVEEDAAALERVARRAPDLVS